MNRRILLLAAALLALTATAAFASDGTFDRSLAFSGAPTVSISTGAGYVHVSPGPDNQVHIVAHVRINPSWFGPDADTRVKQIVASPPIFQSGNIVTIGPSHADDDLYRNVSIDYDVTTPHTTTLKAHTGSGDLQISSIDGTVSAGSGSGSINVDGIGPNARLETGSGGIHLKLGNAAHFNLNAETGSGSVQVDHPIVMQGSLNKHHVSGAVNGGGPTIRATTGSGDVTIR